MNVDVATDMMRAFLQVKSFETFVGGDDRTDRGAVTFCAG